MQAIETVYNGYKFRSRLEARWAVFLDSAEVEYEYEKEGYEFEDGTRYLPDFWLPEFQTFIEIKGAPPTEEERRKMNLLQKESGHPCFLIVGPPWAAQATGTAYVFPATLAIGYAKLLITDMLFVWKNSQNAAKQARFEHGESG